MKFFKNNLIKNLPISYLLSPISYLLSPISYLLSPISIVKPYCYLVNRLYFALKALGELSVFLKPCVHFCTHIIKLCHSCMYVHYSHTHRNPGRDTCFLEGLEDPKGPFKGMTSFTNMTTVTSRIHD